MILNESPSLFRLVKECRGLPIAITAIAKTLLNVKSVAVWRNALRELNKKEEDRVYKCLALSYNHLKDELKPLFLLCGCLSYGDISMYELLRYAVGLDLFDHIKSLEEARDKLVTLVSDLKASSLLLDGEDSRGVSRLLFMDGDDDHPFCAAYISVRPDERPNDPNSHGIFYYTNIYPLSIYTIVAIMMKAELVFVPSQYFDSMNKKLDLI